MYMIYFLLETVHMCGFACSQVYIMAHDMYSLNNYRFTNYYDNTINLYKNLKKKICFGQFMYCITYHIYIYIIIT